MAVDEAMAPMFAEAATLAVSVEPEGGSPGEAPTGPVVASGTLAKV
jgi:anti-sigma-K factor RskA